jgi:L-alanine-DL-glutamate epimerase-like enolase superfamily enzyme
MVATPIRAHLTTADAADDQARSDPKRRACPMTDSATLIDRVDVFGYDLTYAHGDYVMSSGRVVNILPSTVVRITTRGGIQGYGETCPLGSTYLPGFAGGARAALRELAPALIGTDAVNLAAVNALMDATLRGHEYAKSAVDVACWDILGRVANRPVAMLLGGVLQTELPLYVAVPLGEPADMAAFVERERAGGIHHFQLKLGDTPERDRDRVAAVHAVTGPEDAIIGDANGGWRRQDAIIAARLLEGFDRLRLEQPCPTLEECLAVRRLSTLPMVLDEVITDLPTLVRAAAADAMDHINLKVGRVGGLTKARLLRDAAVELGLRLTIEDSWGGDLVTAAVSHLAAATPPASLFAVSYMNDWTQEHIAGYQPRSRDGVGPVPDGPGLGIEVDVEMLGAPLASFGR